MTTLTFVVAGLMVCQLMMGLTLWKVIQALKAINITIGHLIRAQWPRGEG